ncbi:response regulator [Oryzifoliimicrobium ureilyticus]|uniref:response regulator n=1 Tax=Oryzifoliimicrobium ureilyticus TaxID=3113724 RepID=UPI003076176A
MTKDPISGVPEVSPDAAINAFVLVAEDEPFIISYIEDILSDAGFVPFSAEDADKAIAALNEDPARFIGLITDIRMPAQASGWDLARRARELTPTMPVIYMTGDSAAGWAANGVPNSILLQKPFADAQLVNALASLLNQVTATKLGQA